MQRNLELAQFTPPLGHLDPFTLHINLDVPATAEVGGGSTTGTPTASRSTGTSSKRCRSEVWEDFEEIFTKGANGNRVRTHAKCIYYKSVLTGRSCAGTGHLIRHRKACKLKANHAILVQSRLQFNPDGSVRHWDYSPKTARVELCRLIAKLAPRHW